ncbi:MAG: hypothetical protein RDV41_12515 [Planctomycetota bacterium]|nr:hypothetical protein [Planctomycetota bacterium]
MKRWSCLAVAGVLLALMGIPLWAADKPPVVNWRTSWEEGLKEAQMRNVPIFITFHKDG